MNMDRLFRHLRFFWRAESVIAHIHVRHLATRSGFAAFAVFVGLLGVIMLSVAAYFALEPLWGRVWSAAAVGGFHIYLSSMALMIANRMKPGRELELAGEVRHAAMEALEDDAQAIQSEVAAIAHAVRHPLDAAFPGLVVPLIGVVLKALKTPEAPHAA
jgi:drug/metabolite transporter superfamily protein YnfA